MEDPSKSIHIALVDFDGTLIESAPPYDYRNHLIEEVKKREYDAVALFTSRDRYETAAAFTQIMLAAADFGRKFSQEVYFQKSAQVTTQEAQLKLKKELEKDIPVFCIPDMLKGKAGHYFQTLTQFEKELLIDFQNKKTIFQAQDAEVQRQEEMLQFSKKFIIPQEIEHRELLQYTKNNLFSKVVDFYKISYPDKTLNFTLYDDSYRNLIPLLELAIQNNLPENVTLTLVYTKENQPNYHYRFNPTTISEGVKDYLNLYGKFKEIPYKNENLGTAYNKQLEEINELLFSSDPKDGANNSTILLHDLAQDIIEKNPELKKDLSIILNQRPLTTMQAERLTLFKESSEKFKRFTNNYSTILSKSLEKKQLKLFEIEQQYKHDLISNKPNDVLRFSHFLSLLDMCADQRDNFFDYEKKRKAGEIIATALKEIPGLKEAAAERQDMVYFKQLAKTLQEALQDYLRHPKRFQSQVQLESAKQLLTTINRLDQDETKKANEKLGALYCELTITRNLIPAKHGGIIPNRSRLRKISVTNEKGLSSLDERIKRHTATAGQGIPGIQQTKQRASFIKNHYALTEQLKKFGMFHSSKRRTEAQKLQESIEIDNLSDDCYESEAQIAGQLYQLREQMDQEDKSLKWYQGHKKSTVGLWTLRDIVEGAIATIEKRANASPDLKTALEFYQNKYQNLDVRGAPLFGNQSSLGNK